MRLESQDDATLLWNTEALADAALTERAAARGQRAGQGSRRRPGVFHRGPHRRRQQRVAPSFVGPTHGYALTRDGMAAIAAETAPVHPAAAPDAGPW
jgi:hypothetical protein